MLENQGNSVIFYAHYTTDGVLTTGLTVTVDVYEVTRTGTATLVVDDGACTEIGAGLYRYLLAAASVDAAAEYVAVFHTATATVDQQDIPAMWVIDRANQGANVWAYATRALTQSAAQVAAVLSGSTITCHRGDTLTVSLTGLGSISARSKLWFTVKGGQEDTDAQSTLFVEETAGLSVVNAVAYATATDGAIVVTDAATGALTITIKPAVTDDLVPSTYYYDLQMLTAGGVVDTLTYGVFTVNSDITRAVA